MIHDAFPEELLIEIDEFRGFVVRLHTLGWFRIDLVAVVAQGENVTVVRREVEVGLCA
jgi:hypothetical protein